MSSSFLLLSSLLPAAVSGFTTITEAPMPFKWPIVGTLPDFLQRGGVDKIPEIYQNMYKEYGSVFAMSQLGAESLVLSDPRAFDSVLRAEGKFPIGASESVDTFVSYYRENNITLGIKSTSHGPEWKEWRSQLDPAFVAWKAYLPTIAKAASQISEVATYEVNTEKVKFEDLIRHSAFDMFYSVMYGNSPQTTNSAIAKPEDIDFVQSAKTAFDLTGFMLTNPLEKVFQTDTFQKFNVNMDKVVEFGNAKAFDYLKQVREESRNVEMAAETEADEGKGSKCPVQALKNGSNNLLGRLFNKGIADDELVTLTGPLLMAGVDTTAYVMSWLFLNLASNPDVQSKLANELKSVLNGADVTTAEQMNSLPYLKACIRESHRLTPTSVANSKTLEKDLDIDVDNQTYRAKAGTRIQLNLCAIPWDEQYVDKPLEYRPERFMKDAIEARKGTPSEIIDHPWFDDGFGRGKRRCLGANVAKAEIIILASRLIQDWEITLANPTQKDNWVPKQYLMLKADPYPDMKLAPRQ
eukprot:CAMPEP_0201688240 /NCGR_PEP_ID=MMETSP0578-20130828/1981_1 /ASSEMBLY_ACC=CAM_ASM_000663 /TAXON_ID=267565 /ORGANISM="Skeletonema grethea, Strain CCMP 1804" /LENGTH=522 /DNA_ID=CAMNT_0048172473 /DNA_START=138 /DNA_END=1706 /DNA_ORIENTATION=-